jgi:hypothetical protein
VTSSVPFKLDNRDLLLLSSFEIRGYENLKFILIFIYLLKILNNQVEKKGKGPAAAQVKKPVAGPPSATNEEEAMAQVYTHTYIQIDISLSI